MQPLQSYMPMLSSAPAIQHNDISHLPRLLLNFHPAVAHPERHLVGCLSNQLSL